MNSQIILSKIRNTNNNFCFVKHENVVCELHSHPNMEIVIVCSGVLRMEIAGKPYDIKEKEVVFVSPFDTHSFLSYQPNQCYILEFSSRLAPEFLNFLDKKQFSTRKIILSNLNYEFLSNELENNARNDAVFAQSIICFLCSLAAAECKFTDADNYEIVLNAVKILHSKYYEPVTLETVARQLGIHPVTLSKKFTKTMNIGFHKYLLKIRSYYAVLMLQNTDNSITEIALSCGFENIRSFNRIIKELYNKSPTQIRKSTDFLF